MTDQPTPTCPLRLAMTVAMFGAGAATPQSASACRGSACAWWRPVPPRLHPDASQAHDHPHGSCALFEGAQRFRDPAAPEGGDDG